MKKLLLVTMAVLAIAAFTNAATVTGTVYNQAGDVVEGARVGIGVNFNGSWHVMWTFTDADGMYSFDTMDYTGYLWVGGMYRMYGRDAVQVMIDDADGLYEGNDLNLHRGPLFDF